MPHSAFLERIRARDGPQATRKMPPRHTEGWQPFDAGMSAIRYFDMKGRRFQVVVRVYQSRVSRTLRGPRILQGKSRFVRTELPEAARPPGDPELALEQAAREALEDAKKRLSGQPIQRSRPIRRPNANAAKTPRPTPEPAQEAPARAGKASEPAKKRARKPNKPEVDKAKAESVEKGTLTWMGVRERTLGSRTFKQYSITVKRFKKGAYVQLWGARLEAALQEAGAQVGDWVEVSYLGRRPLESDSSKYEKLYEARVLEKPIK